ncbi:MAG: glycine zipper family protein [Lysobacterales bacterium]
MKHLILITCLVAMPLSGAIAAEGGKTLASTLDVFVFPTEGQAADQQSKEESECYSWAVSNTGSDPFELQKQSAQQAQQTEQQVAQAQSATQGAGAKGAVRGAAAGALIGEIADDDAGKGAAYGAAAGMVAGRRRSRAASQQAQQQAKEQGAAQQQATAEQVGNFKKAFSVCLEAKDYMVKY